MYRYFIQLCFLGKEYHGWQAQPNARSVQQTLQEAMQTILQEPLDLIGAGRTDTGVHATCFWAHFDSLQQNLAQDSKIIHKFNCFLPKDISIQQICRVHPEAHARFDATSRCYRYQITRIKDPFKTDTHYFLNEQLDIPAMNKATSVLLGKQDFQCFSKSHTDVKTYFCHIMEAYWEEKADCLYFTIRADRFLRNMVRAITGTLLDIGRKKLTDAGLKSIVESKSRSHAGESVPAHGLLLTDIQYPYSLK